MTDQKIKLFGTASYNLKGALGLVARVREGQTYAEVLELASACLAHTPKSHMKAIRGSIISALVKFDESRLVTKDPLLDFIARVSDETARKQVIFYHILRHNYTLFKVCQQLMERYAEGEVNRKEMIRFIFEHTKSEKGAEYTIQKSFRILKDYEYLGRTQPDRVKRVEPTPEALGYMIYRLFGAGENPAPNVDDILDAPYVKASFFSREGILAVLDEMENEWWYREKTSRNDSITLRFYDVAEFTAQLVPPKRNPTTKPEAKGEPNKPETGKPAAKPAVRKAASQVPAKPAPKLAARPAAKKPAVPARPVSKKPVKKK